MSKCVNVAKIDITQAMPTLSYSPVAAREDPAMTAARLAWWHGTALTLA